MAPPDLGEPPRRGSEYQEQLKYDFNIKGELRHLDTNESFVFNYYKNSHERNHERYQVLGHLITQYVYELLERVCTLQKVYIPTDATEDEPRSFFFMSEKALTSSTSIIVLLQDRGVLHAGQWGQKTIIREGLNHGTQIPFIKMALQNYMRHFAYVCCKGSSLSNDRDNGNRSQTILKG
uniref:Arb2 domain-containing protein n=1 Tax=Anser brachyrhynchus TaxID=132585 RepID=A0A8B9BT36_9AVES